MRTVGVNCDPHRALLAVAEDGAIVDGYPEKLEPPAGTDDDDRLLEFVDDATRAFSVIEPERAGLLLPEASDRSARRRAAVATAQRIDRDEAHT